MLQDSFANDYECKGQTSYELELSFTSDNLYRELNRLQFQQIKRKLRNFIEMIKKRSVSSESKLP